jgi:hypothetical protein
MKNDSLNEKTSMVDKTIKKRMKIKISYTS